MGLLKVSHREFTPQRDPKQSTHHYRFCNKTTFSDITIWYSTHSQRKFFGHRLVLCANSLFLNKALSKQRTPTSPSRPHYVDFDLNGENPASVDYMLRFMYHGPATTLARELRSSEAPRVWMGVYHIARKYEIASLKSYSEDRFAAALNQYLDEMEGVASAAHQTFHELVLDIYRMHQAFGRKANVPEYKLRALLLQHILNDERVCAALRANWRSLSSRSSRRCRRSTVI
jgi:hypothetical protein